MWNMILKSIAIFGLVFLSGNLLLFVDSQAPGYPVCSGQPDCDLLFQDSEVVATCNGTMCNCPDFHAYKFHPPIYHYCYKSVPLGRPCEEDEQCWISNPDGEVEATRCNPDSDICECHDGSGAENPMEEFEGKCHRVKKLNGTCVSDRGCMLGSNEFARCYNATCQCMTYDAEIATFVADEAGMCQIEKAEHINSFSLFSVTIACSVALFVIVLVLYIQTKPRFEPQEDERKILTP